MLAAYLRDDIKGYGKFSISLFIFSQIFYVIVSSQRYTLLSFVSIFQKSVLFTRRQKIENLQKLLMASRMKDTYEV